MRVSRSRLHEDLATAVRKQGLAEKDRTSARCWACPVDDWLIAGQDEHHTRRNAAGNLCDGALEQVELVLSQLPRARDRRPKGW